MDEKPEAYTLGWIPFLGLEIWLDSKPLIPRVETEWWVERVLGELAEQEKVVGRGRQLLYTRNCPRSATFSGSDSELRALDLCAGSGAIGCAVLKEIPNAQVSFGEIDPAHEATIRKNIRENGLDADRAEVRIGDLFAPFAGELFDLILANPPYVPSGRELPASVAEYEPALALRAGEDGLAVIKRITEELPRHLSPNGAAWIECDSEHADTARALFERAGMHASIMHDQYDRPRIIVVRFP